MADMIDINLVIIGYYRSIV